MKIKRPTLLHLLSVCIAVLLGTAAQVCSQPAWSEEPSFPVPVLADPELEEELRLQLLLIDTIDKVERSYVKPITRRELIEAAIEGIVRKLDPYSNYIPPDDISEFETVIENRFAGVGLRVTKDSKYLKVMSPLPNSPAWEAGILPGDEIIAVDGTSTENLAIDEAARLMRGEEGTQVNLTVRRADDGSTVDYSLTRRTVELESVLGYRRLADGKWDYFPDASTGIAYVRLSDFGRDTASHLRDTLAQLQRNGMKGLVLDLRFNPGGLLSEAVAVCDLFIEDGVIVSTQGRAVEEKTWSAQREGTFTGFPMAVIINRYSASASEIVAACLQDHKRAAVVGERSWGKGSVQGVVSLTGEGALKLTTATYIRPSGENIHRFPDADEDDTWGVQPNTGLEARLTHRGTRALLARWQQNEIVGRAADDPLADTEETKGENESEEEPIGENEEEEVPDSVTSEDLQLRKAIGYLQEELGLDSRSEAPAPRGDAETES